MQEQKIWHSGILGMSFSAEEGRILIFRKTLEAVGKLDETSSCEIKCKAFVQMIYKDAGWNKRWSYRLTGRSFQNQRLVSFQIEDAAPIEYGRVLPADVSPTFALCRAESVPAQNNPTSAVKADSGEV